MAWNRIRSPGSKNMFHSFASSNKIILNNFKTALDFFPVRIFYFYSIIMFVTIFPGLSLTMPKRPSQLNWWLWGHLNLLQSLVKGGPMASLGWKCISLLRKQPKCLTTAMRRLFTRLFCSWANKRARTLPHRLKSWRQSWHPSRYTWANNGCFRLSPDTGRVEDKELFYVDPDPLFLTEFGPNAMAHNDAFLQKNI